jgi:tetratricopeptide (TPR) repeat protein
LLGVVVSMPPFGIGSPAHGELPPAAQLVKQAQEACDAVDDPRWLSEIRSAFLFADGEMAFIELARAHALLGDVPRATAALDSAYDEPAAVEMLVRTVLAETTGRAPELPHDMEPARAASERMGFAMTFFKQGDFDKAREQIDLMPDWSGTPRMQARTFLEMAKTQRERGDRAAALVSCEAAAACLAKVSPPEDRIGLTIRLADALARSGGFDEARRLIQSAQRGLHQRESGDEPEAVDHLDWAQLANVYILLGNDDEARRYSRRAVEALDAAADSEPSLANDRAEEMASLCHLRVEAYLAAGRKAEARRSLDLAVAWLEKQEPTETPDILGKYFRNLFEGARQWKLRRICLDRQKADDPDGAMATLEAIPPGMVRFLTLRDMVEHASSQGREDEARTLAGHAAEHDDPALKKRERVGLLTWIAAAYAKVPDREAARGWIDKALAISKARGGKFHVTIALAQIEIGFVEDACETVRAIRNAPDRAVVLAKLAAVAAQREAKPPSPAKGAATR